MVTSSDLEAFVRVLVVDDDRLSILMLSRYLTGDGHEVFTARDAQGALAILGEEPIEAVVTDLHMPGMDGRELLHRIRSDPRTKDLPVIFLTGDDSDEAAEALVRDGASLFLSKPVDLEMLSSLLKHE